MSRRGIGPLAVAPVVAAAALIALAGCGGGDAVPRASCARAPTAPDRPAALGYAFMARMRDESQIGSFALVRSAGDRPTTFRVDDGRGCVAFSGRRPDVRVAVQSADPDLRRHVADEAVTEGLTLGPYAGGR